MQEALPPTRPGSPLPSWGHPTEGLCRCTPTIDWEGLAGAGQEGGCPLQLVPRLEGLQRARLPAEQCPGPLCPPTGRGSAPGRERRLTRPICKVWSLQGWVGALLPKKGAGAFEGGKRR